MKNNEELVILNPYEQTAYFWINAIRNKVKEIYFLGYFDEDECTFGEVLFDLTERDYRCIYLGLIDFIKQYVTEDKIFEQSTEIGGHDKINVAFNELLKSVYIFESIPDIRLASNSYKDSVTYTSENNAKLWYKSCSVSVLNDQAKDCYILSGNEDELDFYNLLIACISSIDNEDIHFNDLELLRKVFCEEYKKNNPKAKIKTIQNMFNKCFDRACSNGLLLGASYKNRYYCTMKEIDLVGLDQYIYEANRYANSVLEEHNKLKIDETAMKMTKKNKKYSIFLKLCYN